MTWIVCKATTTDDGITTVIASTPASDRYGDVVSSPWQLEKYKNNPVVVWGHDYSLPPVGRAIEISMEGPNLIAKIQWDDSEANPLGRTVAHQFRTGFLSAVSVGFQPGEAIRRSALDPEHPYYAERGNLFRDNELLEISAVPIPANPEALARRAFNDLKSRHILEVEETDEGVRVLFAKAEGDADQAVEDLIGVGMDEDEDKENYRKIYKAAYEDINFSPPQGCIDEAKRGIRWVEEGLGGDGLMPATIRWARRLAAGEDITPDKARKMKAWLARHAVDKQAEGFSPGEDGYPSPGRVAWALWCGDAGVSWSRSLVRQMDAEDEEENKGIRDELIKLLRGDELVQSAIDEIAEIRREARRSNSSAIADIFGFTD